MVSEMVVSEVVRDPNNNIAAICNISASWSLSIEKAIKLLEKGLVKMYVLKGAIRLPLRVVERQGIKCLSTDGRANMLDDLPECDLDVAIKYLKGPNQVI
jgi:hypothetical protein